MAAGGGVDVALPRRRLTGRPTTVETAAQMNATWRNVRLILGMSALSILGTGCGGDSKPITQIDFCIQKATKECAGVGDRCLATPGACRTKRVAACEAFVAAQQATPNAAARPFRPDRVGDCLKRTEEAYEKAIITPAERALMDDACARVFSGKAKESEACTVSDYECDGALICDLGFMRCAPKKVVAADSGCNNPGESCPTGQYCVGTPRDCTPRVGSGQACDATNLCVENLRCLSGTCRERISLGATCALDSDCALNAPYCDKYNGSICLLGFTPAVGTNECVDGFGGLDTTGGTGGAAGGTGGAGGDDGAGTGGAGGS